MKSHRKMLSMAGAGRGWKHEKQLFKKRSILQQKCRESIGRDVLRNQANLEATVIVITVVGIGLDKSDDSRDVEKQMNLGQTK